MLSAHPISIPAWPIVHQPSCFPLRISGSWAELKATATGTSVPATWDSFGKGIWLLRSSHPNLDCYLINCIARRGKNPLKRAEPNVQWTQYTWSWMCLVKGCAVPIERSPVTFLCPRVFLHYHGLPLNSVRETCQSLRWKICGTEFVFCVLRMRLKIIWTSTLSAKDLYKNWFSQLSVAFITARNGGVVFVVIWSLKLLEFLVWKVNPVLAGVSFGHF